MDRLMKIVLGGAALGLAAMCQVSLAKTGPSTQPTATQASARLVARLSDIALSDQDLKSLRLERAPDAPEPEWARAFREGWFAVERSGIEVIPLRDLDTGQTVHYGVVLYRSPWQAQAALDVHRRMCNMWAPITAWPKTGDRCWSSTVVKENVVLYASRSGRLHSQDLTAALVARIDAALKTAPEVLAVRDAEAQKWIKLADERLGNRGYTPDRAVAVRQFLAAAQEVPWRYEAIGWLCGYRALAQEESPWSADRDAKAILTWPDAPAAIEALLVARIVLGPMTGINRADATWLAACYAQDHPEAWQAFAQRICNEYRNG